MIGYAMLGTNDLPRALAFYDAVLAELGAKRLMAFERSTLYGVTAPALGIGLPYDGAPAGAGNGTMIALNADSHAVIEATHARALALGGTDEGAPGWRGEEGGFYAGYFRDLDGNKLCAYKIG